MEQRERKTLLCRKNQVPFRFKDMFCSQKNYSQGKNLCKIPERLESCGGFEEMRSLQLLKHKMEAESGRRACPMKTQ